MSLFQCDKCGCLENTALTGAYWSKSLLERNPEALKSYREVLGLHEKEPWGSYCSACNPIWYDDGGEYGIGPRPEDYQSKHGEHVGVWHDQFDRTFLPKKLFATNDDGNLAHIETLDTDVDKYALLKEEEIELSPFIARSPNHLPRPGDTEGCQRYLTFMKAIESAPEHLKPSDERTRRVLLNVLSYQAVMTEAEREELRRKQVERDRSRLHMSVPRQPGRKTAAAAMALMGTVMAGEPPEPAPLPPVEEAPAM